MASLVPRRFSPMTVCLSGAVLLTAAVGVAAFRQPDRPTASLGDTPQQVARLLDGIVQPRFLQNAGRFGTDRVILGGHDDVYELDAHRAAERAAVRRVKASRRPFVIAFLHCRHKPGANAGSKTPQGSDQEFKPFLSTLAAGTKTEAGAQRLRDWADDNLEKAVLPSAAPLRQGKSRQVDFGNWLVVMRPVRASRAACLGCHAGARRGDTLGVMVYAVDKNRNSIPTRQISAGEE